MPSTHEDLKTAASTGDRSTLQTLLQQSHSQILQTANLTLEQLLALGAQNRHAQIVQLCLSLGANVNDSEILNAVIQGNALGVYEAVVPAGYALNYDHGIMGGPLCWVGDNVPVAEYLLSQGADPNGSLQTGMFTPLALAARRPGDNPEMMAVFVRYGAEIDRSGALILAAERGKVEACRVLILGGANVNLVDWRESFIFKRPEQGESALHRAVKGRHEAVVELLLENGVNVDLKDAKGRSPLGLAVNSEMESIVGILGGRRAWIY